MAIPPRVDVTEQQIAVVVADFYAVVRAHPGLGPVFAAHVQDWPSHEAKIVRFWCNALRHERVYDGNPMMAHILAGNVRGPMFAVWLGLFESVLRRNLTSAAADQWAAIAQRIGRALRMGVEQAQNTSGVPQLG